MRYTGNICDGCGEMLQENEDIVVCPECATPQHRHCYESKGGCVNAHLHGEGFVWQGKVSSQGSADTSTLVKQPQSEEEKTFTCPGCNGSVPKGSESCPHCSMKFTIFGMNVMETLQENKTTEENQSSPQLPEFTPPYTIGTGEGFDNEDRDTAVAADPSEEAVGDNFRQGTTEEEGIFKGPYPPDDKTAGIRTNTMGSFIRNNAQSYIGKFKAADYNGRNGFNWAAFIFSPYWYFYRRLYKPGIIMLTIQFILSIVTAPSMNSFLAIYEKLMTTDMATVSDGALLEMTAQLQSAMIPVLLVMAANFIMHLVSGFIANGLYKSYVIKGINAGLRAESVREKLLYFAKNGGSSMMAVCVAYLCEVALTYVVNYIMY